jgi:hypothetical protein
MVTLPPLGTDIGELRISYQVKKLKLPTELLLFGSISCILVAIPTSVIFTVPLDWLVKVCDI